MFLLLLKFLLFSLVGGSTHWVVTEEGKVQEKVWLGCVLFNYGVKRSNNLKLLIYPFISSKCR